MWGNVLVGKSLVCIIYLFSLCVTLFLSEKAKSGITCHKLVISCELPSRREPKSRRRKEKNLKNIELVESEFIFFIIRTKVFEKATS